MLTRVATARFSRVVRKHAARRHNPLIGVGISQRPVGCRRLTRRHMTLSSIPFVRDYRASDGAVLSNGRVHHLEWVQSNTLMIYDRQG
ncbi:hypothetical protein [Burkholderia ubonensis]|uniref:hypothetical protein n=1 Tax=Burkholderia ubonensis TaxID=101571 RepID=UPI00114CEA25|nr:hypothetical protein [Burkholderia ubonensis]